MYAVTLSNSCQTRTAEVDVSVTDCCRLYLPTAFSPNADGVNDTFRPVFAGEGCGSVTEYTLRIYDRWGGEVYRGQLGDQSGWAGTENGQLSPSGAYTYVLSYHNGLNPVQRSGAVLLIR